MVPTQTDPAPIATNLKSCQRTSSKKWSHSTRNFTIKALLVSVLKETDFHRAVSCVNNKQTEPQKQTIRTTLCTISTSLPKKKRKRKSARARWVNNAIAATGESLANSTSNRANLQITRACSTKEQLHAWLDTAHRSLVYIRLMAADSESMAVLCVDLKSVALIGDHSIVTKPLVPLPSYRSPSILTLSRHNLDFPDSVQNKGRRNRYPDKFSLTSISSSFFQAFN